DKSVNKLLWEDIENKNPILRVSSFIALANLKDVKAIPVILKEIMKPKNSLHARKGSVRALMMLKGPVYEILDNKLSRYRRYASLSSNNLTISYNINGKDLASIFVSALQNPSDPLHSDSMFMLGELKEELTYPYLRKSLFDGDPDIVANTAFVLGELGDRKAVDDLIKICKDYRL
ncbi:MAG: hypothetical protein PHF11_07185, partial [Candidatus Omnitrophica bacterium]|nr:hypothetical protein [Candidatus Omnitrophota bacterium]